MSYTIKKSDGSILLTLGVGKIDQITTSLTLIGKNVEPYGEYYNNSLVNLLENFSSDNEPRNPMVGQLWFNTVANKLYVYDVYNHFVLIAGGSGGGGTPATPTAIGTMYGYTPSVVNGSTLLGFCVGNVTMTGFGNIASGMAALHSNLTGGYNIAQGYCALYSNESGSNNVALGSYGLAKNTLGDDNVAIGYNALCSNTNGYDNIAIGRRAMYGGVLALNSGGGTVYGASYNISFGNSSMRDITQACNNFAAGERAMKFNMTGNYNIAIGAYSMYGYGAGGDASVHPRYASNNIAFGNNAMYGITNGCDNFGAGANTLYGLKYGCDNIAIGKCALYSLQSGCSNIGLGRCALASAQYGCQNIAIGDCSSMYGMSFNVNSIAIGFQANRCGSENSVVIGSCAQSQNSGASGVVAIGHEALFFNKNANVVAIGNGAQKCLGYGAGYGPGGNVSVGATSLYGNVNGGNNTAIGQNALASPCHSCMNTAVGFSSQNGNYGGLISSCGNTSVGAASLVNNRGQCNTAIGYSAGETNVCGCNNIFIGACTNGSTDASSNQINLGNSANTIIRAAVTTITALSDCRDKTNITGIPVGLAFIREVNPVKFTWNTRDGIKTSGDELGFIAQELDALQQKYDVKKSLDLVHDVNPDRLEATPGKLLPVLVKAVQDLAVEQDFINARMAAMQLQIDTLLGK